ncbi:TIGR03618 family F420-dependent PPOX class oxidoreductase [Cellulosimicrobium sp. NPDC055967]|uniref:TIGR03618 family F420-dependent PPOX class oxidoreductase n=1 Tax=Cellulosimicrobium sp. NPDC055967 TaxID=3345670 RepID=UPI0035D55E6B
MSAGFVPGPAHVPEVARTLVAGPHVAHLATVLPDGGPHVVPLWVGWEEDRLAFLTGPGSRKARNLARDPRVAVSVTETGNPYVMATLRGRVVEVLDDDAGWAVVDRLPSSTPAAPTRAERSGTPTWSRSTTRRRRRSAERGRPGRTVDPWAMRGRTGRCRGTASCGTGRSRSSCAASRGCS